MLAAFPTLAAACPSASLSHASFPRRIQQPITDKDLPKIQKEMKRLIKRNLAIRREEVGRVNGAWCSPVRAHASVRWCSEVPCPSRGVDPSWTFSPAHPLPHQGPR